MLRKMLLIPTLILVLIATGCGLRFETEIDDTYSPDVEESARSDALEQTERVKNLALSAIDILSDDPEIPLVASTSSTADADDANNTDSDIDHDELSNLLHTIAENAAAQITALEPADATNKDAESTQSPNQEPDDARDSLESDELTIDEEDSDEETSPGETALDIRPLLTQLETGAFQRMSDTAIVTAPLARLLGSISAAQAFDAIQLRTFIHQDQVEDEKEVVEAGFSNIPRLKDTVDASGDWAVTIGRIDRIGYLLETLAAQEQSSMEDLREEAHTYRDQAQDWATALGVNESTSDPRQAIYPTPSLSDDAKANATALEEEIKNQLQELSYDFAQLLYDLPEAERATAIRELINLLPEMQRWHVSIHGLPGLEEQKN